MSIVRRPATRTPFADLLRQRNDAEEREEPEEMDTPDEEAMEGSMHDMGMGPPARAGMATRLSMADLLRQGAAPIAEGPSTSATSQNYRSMPDVARYAHQAPDGTIHYFESDGERSQEGTLPANMGYSPSDLKAQGYTFLTEEEYAQKQRSLDPIARAEDADVDELARSMDAAMGRAMQPKQMGARRFSTQVNEPQE